ncbi:hypothetical protein ANANG_G00124690 [Anguilla anguilla]|uniref:Myoneurin n=1 Tax=Anguilla anguilla TaxID=7936 RepID=A0A9D3MJJ6_ANGAN|nr:hypothetical protein ANANG_G00124690 [Anguilla anguilla]
MPPLPHSERLLGRLRTQREKGFLCDCTVAIGQSMFRAHWNVLAAFSGYFSSLCDTSAMDKIITSLDPECVNEGVFEKLMDYVYSGYLDVDSCNVTEICKAATFLEMEEVVVQCTLTLEDIKPVCSEASPHSPSTAQPDQSEAETVSSLGGFQGPLTLETDDAPALCSPSPSPPDARGTREEAHKCGPGLRRSTAAEETRAAAPQPRLAVKRERERARKSCALKENRGSAFPGGDEAGEGVAGAELLLDEQLKAKPVCYTCGKVFSEASSLRRHMRIHRGVKPYVCQLCDKAFTQCNQLKTHVRTHTGEKPYQCDLCQKGFAQKCQLVFHSRMHHGEEKPYKCDVCGLQFATSSNLKIHSRKHSGEKPYVCDSCGQRFAQASTLTYHVRRHTGEKPYVCDTCGKAFAVSSSLITHSRKHTGEKPYACRTCGKSFTSCGELNKHRRSHTGEKPFICELCGNRYTDVKNLKKHKAKVHKDSPSPDPGQKQGVSPEDPVFWKAAASSLVELKASEAPPPLSISVDHQTMIGPPPTADSSGVSIDQLLRTAIGYTEPQFIFLQQLN